MTLPSLDGLTEPQQRQALLDVFSVPGYDGRLYVLGSFARRVTFYSQQVRALNLVDALCHSGRVTSSGEAAVIGAGVAGLTAAAGLLRRGARVCIFEKIADPAKIEGRMPLQQASKQRVVHPHIYDWPAPDATKPRTDDVLLDWEARPANEVVAQIGAAFEKIVAEGKNKERVRFVKAQDVAIERETAAVTWDRNRERFDVVILAVGFGLEGENTGWHSYWADDDIESFKAAGGTWLISGCGDGALTDLMRLAITQFDHKKVLEEFSAAVPEEGRRRLAEADREGLPPDKLIEVYESVAASVKDFRRELRDIRIWLNCTKEKLYSPQASILNRLIAAFLLRDRKIRLVPQPAELKGSPAKTEKGFVVDPDVMGEADPFPFTQVVVRHGPTRAVEHDFPEIWAACDERFAQWKACPPAADWTRKRLWSEDAFDPKKAVPLPPDVATAVRCLVVVSDQAEKVITSARHALRRAGEDHLTLGNLEVDPDPIVIRVEEVLADPAWYAYAVRALCTCQIAVFDLTDAKPAAALLLGIRAAVRRGVTLTVMRPAVDAKSWAGLPFNIREVGVVSNIAGFKQFVDDLYDSLSAGIKLLTSIGDHYRDLPVYDAVRRLGPEEQFFLPHHPSERILLLSWYGATYVDTVGQHIETCLETGFGKTPTVLRIINTSSPQLISDKLYAEIRRTRFCIVDWTGWRFNVFFELGVRLAISQDEPVSIVGDAAWFQAAHEGDAPPEGPQHAALRQLFAPFEFGEEIDPLIEYFVACRDAIVQGSSSAWPANPDGSRRTVPIGYTYELVRDAIDLEAEPWGTPVWKRLLTTGREILGPIGEMSRPESPLLFIDRSAEKRHERAGVDHLIAAWLYLHDRVEHGGGGEDLIEQRALLADQLHSLLENLGLLGQREYQHLKERLEPFLL